MTIRNTDWLQDKLEKALAGDPVLQAIAELRKETAKRLDEIDLAIQLVRRDWTTRAQAVDRDISLIEERLDNLEAHVGISGDFEPRG